MADEANAAAPNRKLGRYEILEEIGKGGMGVVYRALDPSIGRTVAVKTILMSDQGSPDEVQLLRARLLRESQAAGQLSHPNIVPVFDFGEQADVAYIVMEYISGPTLEQALADDPSMRSSGTVVSILSDCARALDYAHAKGIVHRDIKPGNIMLQTDGTVKIADFGIAKVLRGGTLTMTSMLVGSPYYMAPEQLKGEAVSGRTDQYALATMAYAMLTGRRPFECESMATLVTKTLFEDPPLAPALNPTLNSEVDAVLRKGLAKDPAARHVSCTAFMQALEAALSRPAGPLLGDTTSAPTRIAIPSAPQPTPPSMKRKVLMLLILVVVLIEMGVAGYNFYRSHEASQVELAYWETVKGSKNPELFASYIQRYPNGQFVSLAKAELAALKAAPVAAAIPPPAVAPVQPAPATHHAPAPSPKPSAPPPAPPTPAPTALPDEACKAGLGVIAYDRFQACLDAMSGRGFSPAALAGIENGGAKSLIFAFQHPATRKVTFFTPAATLQDELDKMMKENFRPESVSVLQTISGPLFTEIWVPRNAPFEVHDNLTKERLDRMRQRHQADGYMITDLVPYRRLNEVRYSAIWVKQAGPETTALPELTPVDLGERNRSLEQQGYRIARITGYNSDGGRRYAAVWEKANAGSVWKIKLSLEELLKQHSDMLGKSYHLHHISAIAGEFSAVWWH